MWTIYAYLHRFTGIECGWWPNSPATDLPGVMVWVLVTLGVTLSVWVLTLAWMCKRHENLDYAHIMTAVTLESDHL
jgi:hypothetical protein